MQRQACALQRFLAGGRKEGEGIARRDKVAITGISYGGYATLVGLTFTPEVFCCGVSIVGIA